MIDEVGCFPGSGVTVKRGLVLLAMPFRVGNSHEETLRGVWRKTGHLGRTRFLHQL